ncbi:hypothetical protein lerEdw1_015692 [Lerista edwardsae]|nr:hypothetical protein lerEdw1_015692 [Lerista edwardsae]
MMLMVLDRAKKEGQSRAHLIAQELVSSEKVYVELLRLLHMACNSHRSYAMQSLPVNQMMDLQAFQDFYEAVLKVLGDESDHEEKLKEGLSEISKIYTLHQEILGELEEKVLNW